MINTPNIWLSALVVTLLTVFFVILKNTFNVIFNPTSVQVGQKWDFRLPTNLVGSGSSIFPTTCREVSFENSAQVGQNFLPVDISLENVLTGKENFSATVEICFLKFRIQ